MYSVDITNEGESSFRVNSKDYEFIIDTEGQGVTPPDTLLAGIGSCIGVYVRKYFAGAKLALPKFSIKVEAEFGAEKPLRFSEIKVVLTLPEAGQLDERRRVSLLNFIKNCPVHNTVKLNPEINLTLI